MDSQTLLHEIETVLPHIPKPQSLEITFHKTGCLECEYLRKDMEAYSQPQLPDEAIRYLHGELSGLSSKGLRWVLPSYLKHCVTKTATFDDTETEFLIYALSPELKYQKDTIQRLSYFSAPQLRCLEHFLEWCAEHEHWSDYCAEEIERGLGFVRSLLRQRQKGAL